MSDTLYHKRMDERHEGNSGTIISINPNVKRNVVQVGLNLVPDLASVI